MCILQGKWISDELNLGNGPVKKQSYLVIRVGMKLS